MPNQVSQYTSLGESSHKPPKSPVMMTQSFRHIVFWFGKYFIPNRWNPPWQSPVT